MGCGVLRWGASAGCQGPRDGDMPACVCPCVMVMVSECRCLWCLSSTPLTLPAAFAPRRLTDARGADLLQDSAAVRVSLFRSDLQVCDAMSCAEDAMRRTDNRGCCNQAGRRAGPNRDPSGAVL
eukprot:1648694-Rhodomonas_salina.1